MTAEPQRCEWTVRLRLEDANGTVTSVAELIDDTGGTLSATGLFHTDSPASEPTSARHEIAAARALQRLADVLVTSATADLAVFDNHHPPP
jgi:Domain of unknown function (DUF1876)